MLLVVSQDGMRNSSRGPPLGAAACASDQGACGAGIQHLYMPVLLLWNLH